MKQPQWFARPGIVLSLLALLILLTVLFTKTTVNGRNGDPRLTTTSAEPLGAKLFYLLAQRMGYSVRREQTATIPADPKTIFAVLDPTIELEAREVHNILNHVRSGGALLVTLGNRTRLLSDSLKVSVEGVPRLASESVMRRKQCKEPETFSTNGLWFGAPTLLGLKLSDSLRATPEVFVSVSGRIRERGRSFESQPVVIGIPYGSGRIVIASDPDVLRNDALRVCRYWLDLPMVAALKYLADSDGANRRNLVFDEFHQGKGARAASRGIVMRYLTETQSGNAILQVCIAGLVLLLAGATRVLPPRDDTQVERRSPLEHVDALARAYAQVGATRTGALRLVRGLQRRVGGVRRLSSRVNDDAFLMRVADSAPTVKADVNLVRNALSSTVSAREFVEVGNAIARIEAALTKT